MSWSYINISIKSKNLSGCIIFKIPMYIKTAQQIKLNIFAYYRSDIQLGFWGPDEKMNMMGPKLNDCPEPKKGVTSKLTRT